MWFEAESGVAAVRYVSVHIGVWGGGTHGRARTAGQERYADRQQERYNDRSDQRMAAELPFQDACSLPLSPSAVSVFLTAPGKEARLRTPPRFPAVVAAGQIYQSRSKGRRLGSSGGTISAPSPLCIPIVFHPVATSAQRTTTAWAQGGVRVQRAADLGGRRSIVGAVSPSIPRLRRSSTMSSCRGWPNVSR